MYRYRAAKRCALGSQLYLVLRLFLLIGIGYLYCMVEWGPIFDKGTPPEEVAKVILKAVTTDNPNMRYMVGDDAIQMMKARNGMSDLEFEGLLKQQFFSGQ